MALRLPARGLELPSRRRRGRCRRIEPQLRWEHQPRHLAPEADRQADVGDRSGLRRRLCRQSRPDPASHRRRQRVHAGEQASSDQHVAAYLRNRTIATYWGLHSMVYEGGQDEEGNPRAPGPPIDPTLPNQFAAARDPRMADVELHDLIGNWFPSGGELYMQFAHAGRFSTYGMWGLSDDLTNQSSGKWNGIAQAMATTAPDLRAGTELPAVIAADVRFWRAPPPRFEQWLVRSDGGGIYQLVINR